MIFKQHTQAPRRRPIMPTITGIKAARGCGRKLELEVNKSSQPGIFRPAATTEGQAAVLLVVILICHCLTFCSCDLVDRMAHKKNRSTKSHEITKAKMEK